MQSFEDFMAEGDNVTQEYGKDITRRTIGDPDEFKRFMTDNSIPANIPEPYKKDKGALAGLLDIPQQMYYGYINAVSSMADLIAEPTVALMGKPFEGESITKETGVVPETKEAETVAGSIARPLTQTAVGIGAAGFMGVSKLAEGGKFLAKATPFIKGFAGDIIAFDEHEKSLLDALNDSELKDVGFVKAMSDFIGKDDDDGALEIRLKNALEGAFVGGVADTLMKGVKYVKDTRLAKNVFSKGKEAVDAVLAEGEREIKKINLSSLSRKAGKANIDASRQGKVTRTNEEMLAAARANIQSNDLGELEAMAKESELPDIIVKATDIQNQHFEKAKPIAIDSLERFQAGDVSALDDGINIIEQMVRMDDQAKNVASSTAQAMQVRSKSEGVKTLNQIRAAISGGDVSSKYKLVQLFSQITDPVQRKEMVKSLSNVVSTRGKLTYDATIWIWQNSLLSSTKTFTADVLGTTLWQGYNMAETIPAAMVGAFRKGVLGNMGIKVNADYASFAESKALFDSYADALGSAVSLFAKGAKEAVENKSLAPLATRTSEYVEKYAKDVGEKFGGDIKNDFFDIEAWGLSPESPFAKVVQFLANNQDKTPLYWMAKKDDLIAGIRYAAESARFATRTAKEEGLTGEAFHARVAELRSSMARSGKPAGDELKALINSEDDVLATSLERSAFAETQRGLFRDELGTVGKNIQTIINNIPAGKIIVPFFKTPTKLIWDRFFMERSIGAVPSLIAPNMFPNTRISKMMRAGGAQRDQALGQLAMAGGLQFLAWKMATDGKLIGRLPRDEGERNILLANGVQENSILVGNEWIDISRYSPIADMFLLPANMVGVYNRHEDKMGEQEDIDAFNIMQSSIAGLASVMIDKTWTKNLADFIDIVLSERPDRMKEFLRNFTASFVPALVGDVTNMLDVQKYQQQTLSLSDAFFNRIGLNTQPALDVFGRPLPKKETWYGVIPARVSEDSSDPVSEEMLKNGAYVTKPSFNFKGVRLTPAERYRYMELMNSKEIDVYGQLSKDINTDFYKSLPPDGKREYLQTAYSKMRGFAGKMLLAENPDLANRIMKRMEVLKTRAASSTAETLLPNIVTP